MAVASADMLTSERRPVSKERENGHRKIRKASRESRGCLLRRRVYGNSPESYDIDGELIALHATR